MLGSQTPTSSTPVPPLPAKESGGRPMSELWPDWVAELAFLLHNEGWAANETIEQLTTRVADALATRASGTPSARFCIAFDPAETSPEEFPPVFAGFRQPQNPTPRSLSLRSPAPAGLQGNRFMEPIVASINDTAKALSLGRTSIYSLIREGRLETVKMGRRMPGRPRRQLVLFDQQGVGPAQLRQVVQQAGAHDPATNNDHPRVRLHP
eukprot:gene64426-88109_t